MRPLKIEFQAFGPYAGHESVDLQALSKRGLFLICGKTGIGKTMILDAMTFALFGKSSGHGRDDLEALRCTNADFDVTTFVRFEFENNGKTYCFERRLERKRKNLSPSYNAAVLDEEGVWKPFFENPKEKALNEKAVELTGLEYEQFRQVIVLPQGQFERFLTSTSEEKEKILTSIFGEEKWQHIADAFYEKADERKTGLKEKKDRITAALLEEGCDSMAGLRILLSGKREEEERLDAEYKEKNPENTIKEEQEKLTLLRRFYDLHKAEERSAVLEEKKEMRSVWERELNDAKRAEGLRTLFENEKNAKAELLRRRESEEEAKKSAAENKKAAEEAAEKLRLHIEKEKEIEALKAEKISFEGKRKDYEGLEEAEKELKDAKKKVSTAESGEKEAQELCDKYTESVTVLTQKYSALQSEHDSLLNSYLEGITGELAGTLEEGKPCPVCGSVEHPNKACAAEGSIGRDRVEKKKKEADRKYEELQNELGLREKAKSSAEEKHAALEELKTRVTALSAKLESRKQNLVKGIENRDRLEREIEKTADRILEYEEEKNKLIEAEKKAKDALTAAEARAGEAAKEAEASEQVLSKAEAAIEKELKCKGFDTREEAEKLMLSSSETEALSSRIIGFDADLKAAEDSMKALRAELKRYSEPDGDECQRKLDTANSLRDEYRERKAILKTETDRLEKKLSDLEAEGEGIEEKIREAEEDFIFAKKLRGDSGTGLQRYVLGIMFSSVITAANRMLELVHGGRYRLFRSDEKAKGSNKRGLELKVYDRNSTDNEGRFVSTLSGGEKFLVSLALSIGMSEIAQKSGIRIEALFIDEGFGSLDEDSIGDAMNVLNSIREAKGLVGIISHVQILEDQIASKLRIMSDSRGSRIMESLG